MSIYPEPSDDGLTDDPGRCVGNLRLTARCVDPDVTYADLLADHEVMERLARSLLDLLREPSPQVDAACLTLRRLAIRVRDHLVAGEPMVRATLVAADGTRHVQLAAVSIEYWAAFSELWSLYVYRWDKAHIALDWAAFDEETATVVAQLLEWIMRQATILYSLALHHGVIAAGR